MSLANKYRPTTLKMVVGNEEIIDSIKKKIKSNSIPHAILLSGPSGCGKTTLGRIIATKLKAYDPKSTINVNYIEIDATHDNGIDMIRSIRKKMHNKPLDNDAKVYLFDECHQLSKHSLEGLLKPTEDAPDHVYFILCTTEPQKLNDTLKRRCIHYQVSETDSDAIKDFLKKVIKKEKKKVPDKVIQKIIQLADKSPGKSIALLETVIDLKPSKMLEALPKNEQDSAIIDLCRALLSGKSWKVIKTLVSGLKKENPESVRRAVLNYLGSVLISKDDPFVFYVMECFKDNFYDNGFSGLVLACYEATHLKED